MSGYFVIQRLLYERCRTQLSPTGYKILLELYCTARPNKVVEIPFIFQDRKQGHSKLNLSVMGKYLQMLARLRSQKTA